MPTMIENVIGEGFNTIVGDPSIIGIIMIAFFTVFVFLQDTRLDGKMVVLVPAYLLAMIYIPWFGIVVALGLGALLYLAFMKFTSK